MEAIAVVWLQRNFFGIYFGGYFEEISKIRSGNIISIPAVMIQFVSQTSIFCYQFAKIAKFQPGQIQISNKWTGISTHGNTSGLQKNMIPKLDISVVKYKFKGIKNMLQCIVAITFFIFITPECFFGKGINNNIFGISILELASSLLTFCKHSKEFS